MPSLTRRNRTAHGEPKEESPEVNVGPQMIESSTEFAPDAANIRGFIEQCTREEETATKSTRAMVPEENLGRVPKANIVERARRTRGAVSRAERRSPALLKTLGFLLYTVLVLVLWGLLRNYAMPSLCSFHPLLCPPNTPTPDLSPWTDLLSMENDMFEHLLKDMTGGYHLSIDVKVAQIKITDLRTLIRASGSSQKDLLTDDLTSLLNEAMKSGKDIQTFATNVGRSLDRIMSVNDWALQHIKHDTLSNEHPRVRSLPKKTMEISMTSNFEEAMNVLGNSLEAMGTDIESNSNGLRRIDTNLKAIMRSLSDLQDHPPTKQYERCLQGLKDLERYVDHADYVIGSAYSVIRDATWRLEAIRGRLLRKRVSWSGLNEKHIEAMAVGLEILEEQRVRAKSAQEEMLAGKVQ